MKIDIPDDLIEDIQHIAAIHSGRSRIATYEELRVQIYQSELLTRHVSDLVLSSIINQLCKKK